MSPHGKLQGTSQGVNIRQTLGLPFTFLFPVVEIQMAFTQTYQTRVLLGNSTVNATFDPPEAAEATATNSGRCFLGPCIFGNITQCPWFLQPRLDQLFVLGFMLIIIGCQVANEQARACEEWELVSRRIPSSKQRTYAQAVVFGSLWLAHKIVRHTVLPAYVICFVLYSVLNSNQGGSAQSILLNALSITFILEADTMMAIIFNEWGIFLSRMQALLRTGRGQERSQAEESLLPRRSQSPLHQESESESDLEEAKEALPALYSTGISDTTAATAATTFPAGNAVAKQHEQQAIRREQAQHEQHRRNERRKWRADAGHASRLVFFVAMQINSFYFVRHASTLSSQGGGMPGLFIANSLKPIFIGMVFEHVYLLVLHLLYHHSLYSVHYEQTNSSGGSSSASKRNGGAGGRAGATLTPPHKEDSSPPPSSSSPPLPSPSLLHHAWVVVRSLCSEVAVGMAVNCATTGSHVGVFC
jgi:hypothetical protein